MREAAHRRGVDFPAMVAEVGLWVAPAVHARLVTPSNPTGAVRPDVRRARLGSGERAGDVVEGIRLDRNNYAGAAIRDALGVPRARVEGYQACHVWPNTCYDARYHTVLANLVLVPAPLVSLTDHDPDVIAVLKYRSWELYGWKPLEEPAPVRPPGYPSRWLEPVHAEHRRPVSPAREPRALPSSNEPLTVRPGTQRHVMQELWSRHGGNESAVVRAWIQAVRTGVAERRSNERGQSDAEYARRLIYDGLKRGWLR